MEVLAEESDEDTSSRMLRSDLGADTEEEIEDLSEDDDEYGDGGVKRKEPNQFDGLCDGVLNSVAMVHASLADLLTLKDELITHSLPPNVLTNITMVATKVYRSIGDLDMPVNELIRLVRLYSTPWEQKSTALKKLHQDYESKKAQVNIALKRLQMIDGQAKRIAHERRIMNWEKLFAKMTQARGHGRRWKFMIESFKKHANKGADHLAEYMSTLRDPDQGQEEVETPTEEPEEMPSEKESEPDSDDESSKGLKDSELISEVSSVKAPVYIKPPSRDAETWTHEPVYDRYLNIRVHKPEELDARELRCSVTFRGTTYKTDVLDMIPEEEQPKKVPTPPPKEDGEEDGKEQEEKEDGTEEKPKRPKRGRGLIGRRGGGTAGTGKAISISTSGSMDSAVDKKKSAALDRYEEFLFEVPEHEPFVPKSQNTAPDEVKIAVHVGPRQQLYALATIGMDDFDSLDLPIVMRKPPEGDFFDPEADPIDLTPRRRESMISPEDREYIIDRDKALHDVDKVGFPLYPIQSRISAEPQPIGTVPLLFYWTRRLKPLVFNRFTDSETVTEIVYDVTGFDMNEVTKEDLHKETREAALSAISLTPDISEQEPMIPHSEYTKLLEASNEEIALLQEEYERRLQDLTESFQQMQELQMRDLTHQDRLALSADTRTRSAESRTPSHHNVTFTEPTAIRVPERRKVKRAPPPNYGSSLSKSFFERLRVFEEESHRKRQELCERINQEIREHLMKGLEGQHRVAPDDADPMSTALKDVSLPAVFLPHKSNNMTIFNPRASKYFHAKGSDGMRLTQPPSMLQLPPLPNNKVPVVNLFDMSKNFQKGTQDWLMKRYLAQQQGQIDDPQASDRQPLEREATLEQTGVPNPSLATTPGVSMKTRENTLVRDNELGPIASIERIAEAV